MLTLSQQVKDVPIKKQFIGYGDTAIFNTLRLMKEIINSSIGNYYVRRWAEKIVQGQKTDEGKVAAIYNFVVGRTNYLRDPAGLELLKTPPVSLQLIELGERPQLDCDDYTILSLSLLKSIGFSVAMKAIGVKGKNFQHVYGLVKVKDRWVPLDLTKPEKGLGWEFETPTRITEERV